MILKNDVVEYIRERKKLKTKTKKAKKQLSWYRTGVKTAHVVSDCVLSDRAKKQSPQPYCLII